MSIWHGHDYKTNALGLLLRRFWPMRLVTTVHGWVHHTARTPLYYWLDRLCLPHYEKVICVSEDLTASAASCGVPADRCVLLENGIDADEYRRRRAAAEAKRRMGLRPERLLVGAVGRLSAEKGFDLLIRAVDSCARAGLDLDLVDRRRRGRAAAARSADRGTRPGGARPPARLSGRPAGLVRGDGRLRPQQPARGAAQRPAGGDGPGSAGRRHAHRRRAPAGRHEENGLLVEPGSVEELAGALGRLLRDADLRRRLARAGRRTVEADYSFAVRMDKLRLLYDQMLGHV